MIRELRICLTLFAILFILTGVGYPLATYALSQLLSGNEANGSLVIVGNTADTAGKPISYTDVSSKVDRHSTLVINNGEIGVFHRPSGGGIGGGSMDTYGRVLGSSLIGQNFTADKYFHPRPSAAGNGYDATNSGASNLSPSSVALVGAVKDRVTALHDEGNSALIPVDLVTASASGLDPHISVAAARYQAARVAKARGISPIWVTEMINKYTEARGWGVLGEARVNVLRINMALDATPPSTPVLPHDTAPAADPVSEPNSAP